jgi:hypothetical protein
MGSDLWAKKHEQAPEFCLPDDPLSGDRFDDWVVGLQFEPDHLYHPVSANLTIPKKRQIGRFCGDFGRWVCGFWSLRSFARLTGHF